MAGTVIASTLASFAGNNLAIARGSASWPREVQKKTGGRGDCRIGIDSRIDDDN